MSYPNSIDPKSKFQVIDGTTKLDKEYFDKLATAIVSIQNEMGVKPSGTFSSIRQRLDAISGIDGGASGGVELDVVWDTDIVEGNIVNIIDDGSNGLLAVLSRTTGINMVVRGVATTQNKVCIYGKVQALVSGRVNINNDLYLSPTNGVLYKLPTTIPADTLICKNGYSLTYKNTTDVEKIEIVFTPFESYKTEVNIIPQIMD